MTTLPKTSTFLKDLASKKEKKEKEDLRADILYRAAGVLQWHVLPDGTEVRGLTHKIDITGEELLVRAAHINLHSPVEKDDSAEVKRRLKDAKFPPPKKNVKDLAVLIGGAVLDRSGFNPGETTEVTLPRTLSLHGYYNGWGKSDR